MFIRGEKNSVGKLVGLHIIPLDTGRRLESGHLLDNEKPNMLKKYGENNSAECM